MVRSWRCLRCGIEAVRHLVYGWIYRGRMEDACRSCQAHYARTFCYGKH